MTSTGPSWIWMVVPIERRGHVHWEGRQIEPCQQKSASWVAGEEGDLSLAEVLLMMLRRGIMSLGEWQEALHMDPFGWSRWDCEEAMMALLAAWYRSASIVPMAEVREAIQALLRVMAERANESQHSWIWRLLKWAGLESIAADLGWDLEALNQPEEYLANLDVPL